ncbi:MAG TPA: alkaline phosphatase family protein, partial [Thermoleophilaceae bacterium]
MSAAAAPQRKKLVLAVIDALKPEMLERAVDQGQAPVLAKIMQRGTYVRDCVSSFPSVTPVAAASIATGLGPADHFIPSMNWYHRGERRYVEYGSTFEASRAVGVFRSLQ